MTRLSDLPPNLRRQIADGRARPAKAHTRTTPATPTTEGRSHWTCHTCAEAFDQWAPAERHADETGHRRIALVLEVAK